MHNPLPGSDKDRHFCPRPIVSAKNPLVSSRSRAFQKTQKLVYLLEYLSVYDGSYHSENGKASRMQWQWKKLPTCEGWGPKRTFPSFREDHIGGGLSTQKMIYLSHSWAIFDFFSDLKTGNQAL